MYRFVLNVNPNHAWHLRILNVLIAKWIHVFNEVINKQKKEPDTLTACASVFFSCCFQSENGFPGRAAQ